MRGSAELEETGARVIDGVDLTDGASIERLVGTVGETHIDVLIHNAGAVFARGLGELNIAELRQEYEVNALVPLFLTRALLDRLAPREGRPVSSRAGSIGDSHSGGLYGYRMAKAAANLAGKSLAHDLAPRGVALVLLHPGMGRTDLLARAMGPARARRLGRA